VHLRFNSHENLPFLRFNSSHIAYSQSAKMKEEFNFENYNLGAHISEYQDYFPTDSAPAGAVFSLPFVTRPDTEFFAYKGEKSRTFLGFPITQVIITTTSAKLVKSVEVVCNYDSLFLDHMVAKFGQFPMGSWGGIGKNPNPNIDGCSFYFWKYKGAALDVTFSRNLGFINRVKKLDDYIIVSFYKPRVEGNEK
jgi:hypothetical protein